MTNSTLPTAKKIEKGLYEINTGKFTFSIVSWKSYQGHDRKGWFIYQCPAQIVIDCKQDDYWAGIQDTKRDAIEWCCE